MGVSEMTRFGMGPEDFAELAGLIHDVVAGRLTVKPKVTDLRKRFLEMKYCFTETEFGERLDTLYDLI